MLLTISRFVSSAVFARQHEILQLAEKLFPGPGFVADPVQVDGHDADRTRRVARPPDAPRPAHQFPQVEVEAAAHGPDVPGIHVRPDVVLEIGNPVLGRGLEEEARVRGIPVEIRGQVVGRNREGEDAAFLVAFDHELQERPVDHVHFRLVLSIGHVELPPAHDRLLVLHVVRDDPVERQVRERGLPAPARGDVQPEDELLDVLLDLFVAQLVMTDEGSEQGVHG